MFPHFTLSRCQFCYSKYFIITVPFETLWIHANSVYNVETLTQFCFKFLKHQNQLSIYFGTIDTMWNHWHNFSAHFETLKPTSKPYRPIGRNPTKVHRISLISHTKKYQIFCNVNLPILSGKSGNSNFVSFSIRKRDLPCLVLISFVCK